MTNKYTEFIEILRVEGRERDLEGTLVNLL